MTNVHADVQNYYGQKLQQTNDLKTDACCSKAQVPLFIRKILNHMDQDVVTKYYGCDFVFPLKLEGCGILDLGCGAGRDVFILWNLAGAEGYVIGVDMTKEQLDVARRFLDYHTTRFGFEKPNVTFRLGKVEQLVDNVALEPNSVDVVVSNCIVNLSSDKKSLRTSVSSIESECLSGALCESDLISGALNTGFTRPYLVSKQPIGVNNEALQKLLGDIKFSSCTYGMFKNKLNEDSSTSGDAALITYEKPMVHYENEFQLDQTTVFKLHGKPQYLNAELARMLRISRYAENFKFDPTNSETQTSDTVDETTTNAPPSACCCRQGFFYD